LGGRTQKVAAYEPKPLISGKMGWFILFAVLGFGLARFVTRNLAPILHISTEDELVWILRGLLQGLITALILGWAEKEWKWKVLLTFGICWAIVYPMVQWAIRLPSMLLTVSLIYSLAPALSVLLSSLWTRQSRQWQTYALIFIGWTIAWVIGQSAETYLNPIFHGSATRWILSDALAGGIGLWITVDLLKSRFGEKTLDAAIDEEKHASGSAKLLLTAFLSIVILRTIWGGFQNWFHIWNEDPPTLTQFMFLFVLGGLYGIVVAFSIKKVIPNWKMQHSLMIIIGWAIGLGTVVFFMRPGMELAAGMMAFCGISVVIAIAWANPSVSPIKLALIFLCWALAWKYGNMLGGFLESNITADYAWCFADAVTVLLGLLGTLGIYEYGSNRLVKITLFTAIGFAAGNFTATAFVIPLALDYPIGAPLGLAIWGFIAGATFEISSRNLKKILISGGLCALGLVIGYFSATLFLSSYMDLRNLLWGLGAGLALSLSTRRGSVIVLIAILGAAIFTMTGVYTASIEMDSLWESTVRGAWIGLVLGFGYAYATRELKNNKLAG
jgi:hypothetical protein